MISDHNQARKASSTLGVHPLSRLFLYREKEETYGTGSGNVQALFPFASHGDHHRRPEGIPNAAPYSCVMPILRPLPLIALASALPRDTLRNIHNTHELVVNVMGKPAFSEAMKCAKSYPPEADELAAEGVETTPSRRVAPPRIKHALGWIEARLEKEVTDDKYALIIARVVCSEMNDLYLEGEKLTELPMTMLMPHFRVLGEVYAKRDEIGLDDH